jgi:FKBP-type peptidyl-prolyl cis-trans isomerase FkpA
MAARAVSEIHPRREVEVNGRMRRTLAVGLVLGASACGGEPESAPPILVEATPTAPALELEAMTETRSGLRYRDLVVGEGAEAAAGQRVTVHYAGWILDGEKFDASVDRGETFSFALGGGQVIPGWDEGVAGMRVGGHRRLVIPPELGYGAGGYPPVIPPDATLVFDVQLMGVGDGG